MYADKNECSTTPSPSLNKEGSKPLPFFQGEAGRGGSAIPFVTYDIQVSVFPEPDAS